MLISVEPSVTITLLTNQRVKNCAGVVPEVDLLPPDWKYCGRPVSEALVVLERRLCAGAGSAAWRKSPILGFSDVDSAQTSGKQTTKVTALSTA